MRRRIASMIVTRSGDLQRSLLIRGYDCRRRPVEGEATEPLNLHLAGLYIDYDDDDDEREEDVEVEPPSRTRKRSSACIDDDIDGMR